ncbi:hypothetical protein CPLU01_06236 [Colletotrichum plurivorum]|uniref:Uncharacterized protein n=1 Tax=Colletotrichum plurivorum TaxID=2175906 RepID=A0A8H6KIM3_9PEZI|nr:hypothetical protein CPLU01_06236 [Colletotrichum plurivorum]
MIRIVPIRVRGGWPISSDCRATISGTGKLSEALAHGGHPRCGATTRGSFGGTTQPPNLRVFGSDMQRWWCVEDATNGDGLSDVASSVSLRRWDA